MSQNFLLVFNPVSGVRNEKEEILHSIFAHLPNISFEVYITSGEGDVYQIKKMLLDTQRDGILVGGGDGTVKLVVEAAIDHNLPIGVIPLGSANGLAKCLGINDFDEGIEAISLSKIKTMDILEINGEICLHLSDFGFNASLVKKFDEEQKRGMLTYFKSTLKQFFEIKPFHFELTTGTTCEFIEAKMLVIANGDQYGTGAVINPRGKMDDGMMEIIALNPVGFEEITSISLDMFNGVIDQSDHVKIWQVSEASIKNLDGADFQIDGEVIPNTEAISVSCRSKKVRFFTFDINMPKFSFT